VLISGSYCGYLDPQESIWKGESGKRFKLRDLQSVPDALAPFTGVCGFSAKLAEFPVQTLFRFPLRNTASGLSDKCYNIKQMYELIAVLREEIKYLLLFLRSVQSISVAEFTVHGQEKLLFEVMVDAKDSAKRQEQQRTFIQQIERTFTGHSPYSISKVVTNVGSFDVVVHDERGESKCHWLVVHQVGSTDPEVRVQATKQHVLPWVGTAREIGSSASVGRLFCFLPMPCEAISPLPVHVNGTFALNDNRRSLKWPALERKNDPTAEWNKLLVEKCLPSCYVKLVLQLIEEGIDSPKEIYKAWPEVGKVHETEWSGILCSFFSQLFQCKVLHTETSGGKWVHVQDALLVPEDGRVSAVVEQLLLCCGVKVTTVIPLVWRAFNHQRLSPSTVTHKFIRQVLRKNSRAYRDYSSTEKLELLMYCLSDKNYSDLHGLNLLPLISGEFIQFSAKAAACYLCSEEFPQSLLPNIHHLLVDPVDSSLHQHLENIAKQGYTQLKMLSEKDVGQLLQQYMPSVGYPLNWLPAFWKWVQSRELSLFHGLPLVPVGNSQLAKLTKSAGVVFVHRYSCISPHLASALAKHHVKLAQEQQSSYLRHSKLLEYLHQFSGPGVLDAISSVSLSTPLSEKLVSVEALAFQEFLCGYYTSIGPHLSVFCKLAIFYTMQHPQGSCYSINQVSCTSTTGKAIAEADNYNIKTELMPQNPLVLSQAGNQRRLLEIASSQVSFMNKMDFLCQVLFPLVRNHTYPQEAVDQFMMEVLGDFRRLTSTYKKQRDTFIQTIQNLPFLRNSKGQWKCPKDLFDFSNSDLTSLFKSEAVFPAPPFNQVEYLYPLRECGLRQLNSVTAQELVSIVEAIKMSASHQPVSCDSARYERAKAVVNFLNTHSTCLNNTVTMTSWLRTKSFTLHNALETLACDYSWLPVCSTPPTDYPSCVPWKGCCHQHLASSSTQLVALHQDLNRSKLPKIVGSQVLFVEGCLPQQFSKSLSASFSTLAAAAVDHLGVLIRCKDSLNNHQLEQLVSQVYEFLNQAVSERGKAVVPLQKLPSWVWVGGNRFASPECVALKLNREFRQDLHPFIFVVPSSLSRFKLLFLVLVWSVKLTTDRFYQFCIKTFK